MFALIGYNGFAYPSLSAFADNERVCCVCALNVHVFSYAKVRKHFGKIKPKTLGRCKFSYRTNKVSAISPDVRDLQQAARVHTVRYNLK